MNQTFYHDVHTVPHKVLSRPKTTDHRETFSYQWDLQGGDKDGQTGATLPVANYSSRSIQTNAPMVLLGSNDEVEWHEILRIEKPGIYHIPMAIRAVRPRVATGVKARIVVFINAL